MVGCLAISYPKRGSSLLEGLNLKISNENFCGNTLGKNKFRISECMLVFEHVKVPKLPSLLKIVLILNVTNFKAAIEFLKIEIKIYT